MQIRKAAVLGAGVMGAQIAAHLANAGVPCLLLDIVAERNLTPEEQAKGLTLESAPSETGSRRPDSTQRRKLVRRPFSRRTSRSGHRRQLRRRPAETERLRLDHRSDHRESRDQARALRADRAALCIPIAIVSSNTSGIPIAAARRRAGRELPPAFSRHALLQSTALPASSRTDPHAGDCR